MRLIILNEFQLLAVNFAYNSEFPSHILLENPSSEATVKSMFNVDSMFNVNFMFNVKSMDSHTPHKQSTFMQ